MVHIHISDFELKQNNFIIVIQKDITNKLVVKSKFYYCYSSYNTKLLGENPK